VAEQKEKKKDFWLKNLFRHQLAGAIAFFVDFLVFVVLMDTLGLHHAPATAIGALVGALINFLISSFWAFSGSKNSLKNQLFKYILVSTGSIILNTLFLVIFTDLFGFDPKLSKLVTAILVGSFYNFLLMRNFVFKK
jgi:putative flippase GtrA